MGHAPVWSSEAPAASPPGPTTAPAAEFERWRVISAPGSHRALWLGLASVAAVSGAALGDRWLSHETLESASRIEGRLAAAAQPFGNPALVLPAALCVYGAGRWLARPAASAGALRVGATTLVAGASALAIKQLVGRARPEESPDDPWNFAPFSGHQSFPSGHATLAFAVAGAVDRETSSRWVPWLVYPLAAAVGWSRVHQGEHWTSDVVAGAALGTWTASWVGRELDRRRAIRRP